MYCGRWNTCKDCSRSNIQHKCDSSSQIQKSFAKILFAKAIAG
ncbi:unnamed protein product [Moneuplotes crassus]|uniref:Uncharacterized protein n=1 Tax=Euplotes crassus TaxID=5936 RepID=A0AAD1UGX4_EUPCR|nr:unnamed protein product [Moneuplotes crassus]